MVFVPFISMVIEFCCVIPAQVTLNVHVAQKRSSSQKSSMKYILDGGRMKVCKVGAAVISQERVHHILHAYCDMKKLSARWMLTVNQCRLFKSDLD